MTKITLSFNFNKKNICFGIALLIWGVTFFTDTHLFTADALNMNSLPIDMSAMPFMYLLTKFTTFAVIYGMTVFFFYAFKHKKLLFSFLIFFVLYITIFLLCYPGWYMSDDLIIFGYATRFYPVYWHHYLTSLYYMTGMSLFPASTGPVFLNDLCLSLVFSYIYFETDRLYQTRWKYLILICGILPFVLLSCIMCFRPVIYSPFFLFFYAFLFFEKKKNSEFHIKTLILLSLLTAVLCSWRSEGIILSVFLIPLLPLTYYINKKKFILFFATLILFFSLIRIPQQIGENKYYGKDYLIITTIRPLSLIIQREQNYPEAVEDWGNIKRVIDLNLLGFETLSCSSYNNNNSKYNGGHYTETGAGKEKQNAFLKSALRLILKNPDLYFAERIQLFLATNGIYNYDPEMVLGKVQVETFFYYLFKGDMDYGEILLAGNQRLPITGSKEPALFLFRYGGEAYIPVLILLLTATAYCIFKKRRFFLCLLLSVAAREIIIFLTVPAGFIQYNYPSMFVIPFLCLMLIIEAAQTKYDHSPASTSNTRFKSSVPYPHSREG